jgi:hypothetical protein
MKQTWELRKRACGAAEAQQLFAGNLAAFERAWCRVGRIDAEDAGAFRERNRGMRALQAAAQAEAAA